MVQRIRPEAAVVGLAVAPHGLNFVLRPRCVARRTVQTVPRQRRCAVALRHCLAHRLAAWAAPPVEGGAVRHLILRLLLELAQAPLALVATSPHSCEAVETSCQVGVQALLAHHVGGLAYTIVHAPLGALRNLHFPDHVLSPDNPFICKQLRPPPPILRGVGLLSFFAGQSSYAS